MQFSVGRAKLSSQLQETRNRISTLKYFLGGVFGISSLVCLGIGVWIIPNLLRQLHAQFPLRSALFALLFPALAVLFGAACWAIWRRKSFANVLGIIASLTQILLAALGFAPHMHRHWLLLALGLAGLYAFMPREQRDRVDENSPLELP